MNRRKKKHIENLLKQAPVAKAPKDFVSNVMNDVEMLTNEELLKDAKLSELLKKGNIEQPSPNFMSNVMEKVQSEEEFSYQPIISKRSWFLIVGVSIAIIAYVISISTTSGTSTIYNKTTPYLQKAQSLWQNFSLSFEISPLLVLSLVSLTFLVFIDYASKSRNYI